jgi:hypothetical protein
LLTPEKCERGGKGSNEALWSSQKMYMIMEFWLSSSRCWDYRRSSSALDLSATTRSNFHRLNRLPQMQLITDSNSSSRKLAIAFYNKLVFFDSAGSQKARWKKPALGWAQCAARQVDAHCSSEVRSPSSRKRACSNCAGRPFFEKHWVVSELVIPAHYRKLTD